MTPFSLCPGNFAPVCGCDQRTYTNDCARQASGVQLDHAGGCASDAGVDAAPTCAECNPATQYCQLTVGGVDTTARFNGCFALPAGCGTTPACACLSGVACGSSCSAPGGGGPVTVTCLVP